MVGAAARECKNFTCGVSWGWTSGSRDQRKEYRNSSPIAISSIICNLLYQVHLEHEQFFHPGFGRFFASTSFHSSPKVPLPNVAELCPMWLLIGAGFGCNTADAAVFDVQERSRGSVWLLMVVSVVMIA